MNIKITLTDVNDHGYKLILSESMNGNVVVRIESYSGQAEVIVDPDELARAVNAVRDATS